MNLLLGNKRSISQARPVCQLLHHNKPLGRRSDPVRKERGKEERNRRERLEVIVDSFGL